MLRLVTYDPRPWLSVSQVSSLVSCGRAYEIERIEKIPGRPAAWTVTGIAVHDVLDWWEKGFRQYSELEIDAKYEEAWAVAYDKTVERYPDVDNWIKTPQCKTVARDVELRQKAGRDHVRRYILWAKSEEHLWMPAKLPNGTLAVEVPFKIDFGSDEPFFVRGYIDKVIQWVDGTLTIDDIKTGGDDRENARQLAMYRFALNKLYGWDITHGRYYYTKLNRPSPWIDLTPFDEAYLKDYYDKAWQIKEQGLFLANPSKKGCLFCGVRSSCREMKDFY